MTDFRTSRARGWIGEELAAQYLSSIGYKILEQNYRGYHAEVDIVCRDGEELVFVEVKSRRSMKFGRPEESILPRKISTLVRGATGYIQDNVKALMPTRFDVVTVTETDEEYTVRHIPGAFSTL